MHDYDAAMVLVQSKQTSATEHESQSGVFSFNIFGYKKISHKEVATLRHREHVLKSYFEIDY